MSKKVAKSADTFYCETLDLDYRLLDKFFSKGGDKLSEAKSELFKDIESMTAKYRNEIAQRIDTFERTYGEKVNCIYRQHLGIGDNDFYGVVTEKAPRKHKKGGH